MNIKDDFILKNIHEGYLVGGSVRDFIMGKTFKDRDIAIREAEIFAKKLADELDATFITLDDVNKIFRVVLKDKENYLDISELRGKSIEEDLLKRDFTVNAVAYDLKAEKYIDVTGGIKDIQNHCLRIIKEENLAEDPLRILRAFRFMSTLNFEPEKELIKVLKKYYHLVNIPAKERIHDEIIKLFGGKHAAKTLISMYDSGILELIFPVVKDMAKVPSNSHHHLDLVHHVIETVKQIELQMNSAETEVINHLTKTDFGGYPRINYLKLAGFLHDIGKFSTWTIEDTGRHRFIKHDLVGAKMVIPLLRELKFSNKQIEYISEMIRQHIYPSNVISSPNFDNKVMLRYIRKMGENVIDNITLAKADRLSAQGPDITKDMLEANINGLNKLLNFYIEIKPSLKPLPKLLDGNEIMQLLGIKQSPKLGYIIKELHEAQLNGDINTKKQAENFIREIYAS